MRIVQISASCPNTVQKSLKNFSRALGPQLFLTIGRSGQFFEQVSVTRYSILTGSSFIAANGRLRVPEVQLTVSSGSVGSETSPSTPFSSSRSTSNRVKGANPARSATRLLRRLSSVSPVHFPRPSSDVSWLWSSVSSSSRTRLERP